MKRTKWIVPVIALGFALFAMTSAALAAISAEDLVAICNDLYAPVFGVPNSEPFGPCQWDMALINANEDTYARATGAGVTVGVIDGGVDFDHPDVAPNLNVDLSCSFIFDDTPTATPEEITNGDCSNKAAVEDLFGHGTHVASIIAAPINGIGIAGVAPEATIVALKVCTRAGYCFTDSVAAALRYAGDHQFDIVNLSLYADPYLYYCKSEEEQRAMLREVEEAARYARQRGVLIVAAATNEQVDMQHPGIDDVSPNWPPESAEVRDVMNNCRVAPAELPETMTVSATGPIGYPGYDMWIASYSAVGMSRIDVAAPGGDFFSATGTVHDAILGAMPIGSELWNILDSIFADATAIDQGAGYLSVPGTSMSSPHAAGVAALVKELHPEWGPDAVEAAVQRSAQHIDCPPDWAPLGPDDERERCYGGGGRTSFFGHGLVDAWAATEK